MRILVVILLYQPDGGPSAPLFAMLCEGLGGFFVIEHDAVQPERECQEVGDWYLKNHSRNKREWGKVRRHHLGKLGVCSASASYAGNAATTGAPQDCTRLLDAVPCGAIPNVRDTSPSILSQRSRASAQYEWRLCFRNRTPSKDSCRV
jgi:hypothetical protein